MKNKWLWVLLLAVCPLAQFAQSTFPTNGASNPQVTHYTFINANIQVSPTLLLSGASLEINQGKIVAVKKQGQAYDTTGIIIDVKGKYIYPSFIDIYSTYGVPQHSQKQKGGHHNQAPQYQSDKKGAFGWNEAIKPETDAAQLFVANAKEADELRQLGFGTVATFVHDGIARGTSVITTLTGDEENKSILAEKASANYAFKKGSSQQQYPTSLMGSMALLRQTFYDAQAYKSNTLAETNLSLQALNNQQNLPQIFEANNKWDILRIQAIAKEFGKNIIIKTNGDEYQISNVLANTNSRFIVPVNFPEPIEIKNVFDEAQTSFASLYHNAAASENPFTLQQKNIPFAFTADGLKNKKEFLPNIIETLAYGLSEETALAALTTIPAQFLNVGDKVGTLEVGKQANFIITAQELFTAENILLENWVQGKPFVLNQAPPYFLSSNYNLFIGGEQIAEIKMGIKKDKKINIIAIDTSSKKVEQINYNPINQEISFTLKTKEEEYLLSGWKQNNNLWGTGSNKAGQRVRWEAKEAPTADTTMPASNQERKLVLDYSKQPYTYADATANTFIVRNVTVWTNEKEGIIPNTNVLVVNGKIAAIGDINSDAIQKAGVKNPSQVPTINGTGKHLSTGIIDEHSHIAIMGGVNEASQSSTAEVRISDVINPEDINIYRQLAGGVTTSQLLHGSANVIGGQSAVIKLKWGAMPSEMLFADAPPRIKFALGENVKQSNWGDNVTERFPQTRMGVEQVFENFFSQAKEYEKTWNEFKSGKTKTQPRKDLELEALLEVVNGKRLVSCHSYSQQEINMLMKVAEKYGFTINIFTHVLEGYKIADKLKQHGAGASTFSDWWGYKYEVIEASAYNAALLNQAGVTTCINSDDAEMGRRLNQEAAKAIKYGGVSEEDALKMITLNPAKLMGIDNRVGSIKVGKDADLVLWSGNPLSIYSKPIKTFIDGVAYFDAQQHQEAEAQLLRHKQNLIRIMNAAIAKGKKGKKPEKEEEKNYHCDDEEIYGEEANND